ncbi:MAG: hypothetical protein MUE68_05735 [Bacteroidetes bacterium]|jgi:hypothetical protein|nr:hypothetical protein [Bacteroidota bacterium]
MRLLVTGLLLSAGLICSPTLEEQLAPHGTLIRLALSTAPFPHPGRDSGHVYNGVRYPAELHYRDSTVLVFIPNGFDPQRPLDLAVHIHGWWAGVETVISKFRLAEQLTASGKNAVLVIPQGPTNAPDSFGGRLEDPEAFRAFIEAVGRELHERRVVASPAVRSVVLSGHSGAYRMISFILRHGGAEDRIREVYLFDALYGQLETYAHWLSDGNSRFVAVFCDSGGTKEATGALMDTLGRRNVPFASHEETDPRLDLRKDRITFIHSDLGHNEVLMAREQYRRYLESGTLGNRK